MTADVVADADQLAATLARLAPDARIGVGLKYDLLGRDARLQHLGAVHEELRRRGWDLAVELHTEPHGETYLISGHRRASRP